MIFADAWQEVRRTVQHRSLPRGSLRAELARSGEELPRMIFQTQLGPRLVFLRDF